VFVLSTDTGWYRETGCNREQAVVLTSVAMILPEVYHDNVLLSRHVSRYITISAYCEIGRVRVIRKKY
jgi:hypothetical protein